MELKALKEEYGGWTTAYLCINDKSVWQSKVLFRAVQPTWAHHTRRLKTITSPEEALKYEIVIAQGGWQQEVKDCAAVLLDASTLEALGCLPAHDDNAHLTRLSDVFDLMMCIMAARAQSLSHHDEPPRSFANLLKPEVEASSAKALQDEWSWLLQTEELVRNRGGAKGHPLMKLSWRESPIIRYPFMLLECGHIAAAKKHIHQFLESLEAHRRHSSTYSRSRSTTPT